MVLGPNIENLVFSLALYLSSFSAISSTGDNILSIEIDNNKELCSLVYGTKSYKSKIKSPCLVATYKNTAQFVEIKDRKVYVLVGKPASKEFISNWNVTSDQKCSDHAQAFTIHNNKLEFYNRVVNNTLICPFKYIDEKLIQTMTR